MYKGLLTSVRVLQLVKELKLSGSIANFEQNNNLCDSMKYTFDP